MLKRSTLYRVAKIWGDVNAVRQGKVAKRTGRRLAGKYTGKRMGGLFGR